jgi:hypothetical protein
VRSIFSTVKFELGEHFDSCGEANMQSFDYIEVFYNQRRRHSTLGQISPAAYERQGARPARVATAIGIVAASVVRAGMVQPTPEGHRRSWGIV